MGDIKDAEIHVQHTQAADGAAQGRVQEKGDKSGEAAEKIILFPMRGPGEIEEDDAHFETEQDENGSRKAVHDRGVISRGPGEENQRADFCSVEILSATSR